MLNIDALKPFEPLLVAVSGGSDSVALLRLLHGKIQFSVATVNHALREGSLNESLKVKQWCDDLSVPCTILTWEGEKPSTNIQQAAREARYNLLIAHAKLIGAKAVVTAHTLNDQAETVLMRLIKGSSPLGLAGMNFQGERDGFPLLRPLLWVEREDLRSFLKEKKQEWIDDSSNDNIAFLRVRLRQFLPVLEKEGLSAERLGRFAARQNLINETLEFYARDLITKMQAKNKLRLEAKHLLDVPFAVGLRAVSLLLEENGDKTIAPRLEKEEALSVELITAIAEGEAFHATLRGAKVTLTPNGILRLSKEEPRSN